MELRFTRSIRFRLSALYSALVFGLGGLLLGLVYAAIRWQLTRQVETRMVLSGQRIVMGDYAIVLDARVEEAQVRTLESLFNQYVLDQLARWTLLALALLFVISLVVGWIIAGRALAPVDRITQVAREIEASDLSRRIDWKGPDDELTRLAATFDGMLDRLERAFRSQRKFLADTSHDLRTPLSVIRSNVEVTLDDPETTVEEWRSTGDIVVRNADRMGTMIDGLLAAARFESGQATMVKVDLAALVAQAAEDHAPTAAAAGVRLIAQPGPAPVMGEPVALTRALNNLVDNALRLAPKESRIRIVSGTHEAGWAYLGVADQGPGFEVNSAGTGFGLSIVEQVALLHRGSLQPFSAPGEGTTMVLWLRQTAEGEPPPANPLPPI